LRDLDVLLAAVQSGSTLIACASAVVRRAGERMHIAEGRTPAPTRRLRQQELAWTGLRF
jgi:hypothetical protein